MKKKKTAKKRFQKYSRYFLRNFRVVGVSSLLVALLIISVLFNNNKKTQVLGASTSNTCNGFNFQCIFSKLTTQIKLPFFGNFSSSTTSNALTITNGMGVYDFCGPGSNCFSHLDTFHQAGFTVVLDYNDVSTSIDAMKAYAQRAEQDNIKIIWSLKDLWNNKWTQFNSYYYGDLVHECGCTNKMDLAKYVVDQVRSLPATWGYYLADEATLSDKAQIAQLSNMVKQEDPLHPRLLVENDALENGYVGNVIQNLPQFSQLADVLGEDYYPVSYGQDLEETGNIARAADIVAQNAGKKSAMVLEVNSGNSSDYIHATAYPSEQQMQHMLTLVQQRAHPALILWYWYRELSSAQWNNLINAVNGASEFGTCGDKGQYVCTTNPNEGVIEYQDQTPGDACSIDATLANAQRSIPVYCCSTGHAQYTSCGSTGQYVCTTSCPSSNIMYTGYAAGTACSIAGTKVGLPRNTKVYCVCKGSNCPVPATPTPTPTPTPNAKKCTLTCAMPPVGCQYKNAGTCSCGTLVCSTPTVTKTPTPILTATPTPKPFPTPTPTSAPVQIGNVLLSASNTLSSSSVSNAMDGKLATWWNSGKFVSSGSQWIELNLQRRYAISAIRLNVQQTPSGNTIHNVYAGSSSNPSTLVAQFSQNTSTGQWLEKDFSTNLSNIQYIRITTTQSPSWVAWNEIQVYGQPAALIMY